MDAQRELQQLDESLSEMTDLLLTGDAGDDLELEGDFEVHRPEQSAPRDPPSDSTDPPADAAAEVEQAQAAVAAAMEGVVQALESDGAPEPEPVEEPEAQPPPDPDSALDAPPSPDETMQAVAAELERQSDEAALLPPPDGAPSASAAADQERATPAQPPQAPDGGAPPEPADAALAGDAHEAPEAPAEPLPAVATAERPGQDSVEIPRETPLSSPRPSIWSLVAAKAAELAARAVEPVAAWLGAQPSPVRQSIAWIAVWTAFNAACVWSYVLLFRTGPAPEVGPGATQIVGEATVGDADDAGAGVP